MMLSSYLQHGHIPLPGIIHLGINSMAGLDMCIKKHLRMFKVALFVANNGNHPIVC